MNTELRYACISTQYGAIILFVKTHDTVTDARGVLRDVLLLHELEPLTQSLEDQLKQALDWQADSEPVSAHGLLECSIFFNESNELSSVRLIFPVNMLHLLANWKKAVAERFNNLSWRPLACTLCLSEQKLLKEEQGKLGEGALMIIPESFEKRWAGSLTINRGSLTFNGSYQWTSDTFTCDTQDPVVSANGQEGAHGLELRSSSEPSLQLCDSVYQVQLDCEINPAELMQASVSVRIGLSAPESNKVLALVSPKGSRFTGSLLSIGSGQALLLESIYNPVS